MLLANNILLAVAMASVLLGTLYPLFLDALNAGKISVGPPYFEAVFGPLMAPLVFLMGVGPVASWRRAELPSLWTRLRWALGVAIACALVLPFVLGRWSPLVAVGLFLALWVVASTVTVVVQRFRSAPQASLVEKLRSNSSSWYGMLLAHLGVATFIVGVTLVKGYEVERDVRLDPGGTVEVGGYAFTFKGIEERPGPNYQALVGTVEASRGGTLVEVMHPEKRIYRASGQTMTEAAIDTRLIGDLYVSLGEPVTESGHAGAWGVRIYVKPFIDWIWGGCVLMALGGFLAVADRRYRIAIRERVGAAFAAARA
jgi:cytochrome c-type biogenesis protein CcmF